MIRCAIYIRNIIFATVSTLSVLRKNHIRHYKHQSKCVWSLYAGELIFVLGWESNIGPHGQPYPYSIGPCVRQHNYIGVHPLSSGKKSNSLATAVFQAFLFSSSRSVVEDVRFFFFKKGKEGWEWGSMIFSWTTLRLLLGYILFKGGENKERDSNNFWEFNSEFWLNKT